MIRFSFFGIPVEIQPWFWVIMALIGSSFGRIGGSANEALVIALFVIAGGLSIFVHELGHALTGRFFRARPFVVLHGFGGYAAFPGSYFTRSQSFIVTAAGPLVQLLLGGLAFALLLSPLEFSPMFKTFIIFLFSVSIFWALLNLIPVFPLDGGQMLAAALGPQRRKLCLQISIVAAVVGAILLWQFKVGIFMPFFLLYFAWQNYQELKDTGY
jgi:stage IV sporulation protein FB